jgi:hypothetical protein
VQDFQTPKMNIAIYLVATGAPMPELLEEMTGRITFVFHDPQGEWQQEALRLDLRDTESDQCSVPVARIFAAERILRDAMRQKKASTPGSCRL